MDIKSSRYNYLFSRDNTYYVFNTESCTFIEITQEMFHSIKSDNIDQINDVDKAFLMKKKILVSVGEYDDFIHKSKIKYLTSSYDSSMLSLVLVPTTGCNFTCSYCFEKNKQNIVMTDEVINNLIIFIKEHTNAKKISITWYGGEPLMGFSSIKKTLSSIKKNVTIPIFSQTLITNGYLLNEHKIAYFKEIGLNSMQITLDGKKDTHNTARALKGTKKGSYDIILDNIDKVVSIFPECNVALRINISNNNKEDFIPLYKDLSARWKSSNVYIYPGFIREDSTDSCSFTNNTLNSEERFHFYREIHKQGCPLSSFPQKADKGCMINRLNSYIIGPQGEIYKCWNDVTNPDKIIGYINQKELINKQLFYSCMEYLSPFNDVSCTQCFLFPICSGGCGWYRHRNSFEAGKFNICPYFKEKERLEDLLLLSLEKKDTHERGKKINCWS